MKMYGGMEVQLHAFLTLALNGGEWSASFTSHITTRERTLGTYWVGGWVDPRAGLDKVAKRKTPYPCQELKHGHPAHNLVTILTEICHVAVNLLNKCHGQLTRNSFPSWGMADNPSPYKSSTS
jgi:hypothetical protein